jgi:hypothetical protein
MDDDPYFSSYLNNIEYESLDYFHHLRKSKGLRFGIFARLLRSLKLSPAVFGFPDGRAGGLSSYILAYDGFKRWYEDEFIKVHVFLDQSQIPEKHSRYLIYSTILTYLRCRSLTPDAETKTLHFKTFMIDLFSLVFSVLDAREDFDRELKESLLKVHRKAWGADLDAINDQPINTRNPGAPDKSEEVNRGNE